ncbi:hypothetical protein JOM56_001470 [Amanita muscaria]
MASTARQTKSARKGLPDSSRRGAWGAGARSSPTFSASNASRTPNPATPPSQGGFSPPAQTNGSRHDPAQERILQSLTGLTGTTVVLSTKTAQRYEGVVSSTSSEGDTIGVTLKDVKDISNPGVPLKDHFFVALTNIASWDSGPADSRPSNGDTFRTDTDISQKRGLMRERELQAWQPGADIPGLPPGGSDDTFGPGNISWDQFAVNEKLFGVTTNFDEDVYTTKLDRSGPDFKERERKAQRIANEILGTTTNNPHVMEERGHVIDSADTNEEDKYGAVVRGSNAYIPPAARKAAMASAGTATKPDAPKISVNGPDGTQVPAQLSKPSTPAPAPATSSVSTTATGQAPANKPPADPLPAFRDFVVNEKQRLTQKRQALVRSEMDKKISELVKFGQSFKLNKPIPEDLVTILAKDEEKQRAIRDKATQDAQSSGARSIGAPSQANATRGVPANVKPDASRKLAAATAAKAPVATVTQASSTVQKATVPTKAGSADNATKRPIISMYIQPIPAFRGGKVRQQTGTSSAANGATPITTNGEADSHGSPANPPASPNTARLNVNASSFRPKAVNAFSPGSNSPNASNSNASLTSGSPKVKPDAAPATPNPFFGKQIKKATIVSIKDDFNPFKHGKITEPAQTSHMWPYTGKRYTLMFPMPQHPPQPHTAHIAPPGPPPMPPPSYEEDSAAQAAARGYVYAYPPYGYPGQPMMPGMAPPGPPTAYLPGPFMQHMPYPPGMPPPAMYSPAMGQMPPPQAYMPPPGAYPQPPNGAAPRPSMPPTPIPTHAHPYYHQSPQMQHAVPYPMMMPPPQSVASHPYEGGPAPPVQMGGHA